jgi:hypothetical protein
MTIYNIFKWLDATPISKAIRDSTYIFPVVEVLHLFGLTLLLGTVMVMCLRMLGFGMRRQTTTEVNTQLMPWAVSAAVLTIVTGILLFLSEAMKCYGNEAFPYKMWFLLGGIILYVLTGSRMRHAESRLSPVTMKIVAVLTLALWFGVAIAGRAIAFV